LRTIARSTRRESAETLAKERLGGRGDRIVEILAAQISAPRSGSGVASCSSHILGVARIDAPLLALAEQDVPDHSLRVQGVTPGRLRMPAGGIVPHC